MARELDPDRSSAADTYGGPVLANRRHYSEDLLEITIDCSTDGFASIRARHLELRRRSTTSRIERSMTGAPKSSIALQTPCLALHPDRLQPWWMSSAHPPHLRQPWHRWFNDRRWLL